MTSHKFQSYFHKMSEIVIEPRPFVPPPKTLATILAENEIKIAQETSERERKENEKLQQQRREFYSLQKFDSGKSLQEQLIVEEQTTKMIKYQTFSIGYYKINMNSTISGDRFHILIYLFDGNKTNLFYNNYSYTHKLEAITALLQLCSESKTDAIKNFDKVVKNTKKSDTYYADCTCLIC